jgi:hypothetical protein
MEINNPDHLRDRLARYPGCTAHGLSRPFSPVSVARRERARIGSGMNEGLWIVIAFLALLLILFLAYRALTEWEVLDNQRRQRERERVRDSKH